MNEKLNQNINCNLEINTSHLVHNDSGVDLHSEHAFYILCLYNPNHNFVKKKCLT